ncbi:MAG: hypothetical protein OK452_06335 [Thaumarchaeota archaeon]|nr:hypothetical protein [Nitrososphaerota archaeon]
MDARLFIPFLLVLLLPALPVKAQVSFASQVGLGYSPGTLTPIGQEIPVYASGDQMWIVSYGVPLNMELLNASGKPAGTIVLGHMQPTLLHVFTNQDKPGTWVLNMSALGSGSGFSYLGVELSGPGTILPQMTSVKVDSAGLLSLGFKANLGSAYDTSVCLVGRNSVETVKIPIPAGLGNGQLLLSRNGTQTTIQPNGQILSPFSFWFELHAGRSYQATSALITRDVEEAASTPIPFSAGSTNRSVVDLSSTTSVREGRATVRAFFESSAGLQTLQSQVLIPDYSTWEWLPGCTSSVDGVGSNFTASASLKLVPELWPRAMYFMYSASGVEAYSKVPVTVLPSVVNLVAVQWGAPLTDKGLSLAEASGVTAAVGNSTIFLAASTYPVEATLRIPGPLATQPLLIAQPFSVYTVPIPAGRIAVQSLFNGAGVSNSNVSLRLANQTIAIGKGSPIFYVPPGSYTLFASYHGTNRSVGVVVANGTESSIVLEFGTAPSQTDNLLIGTAAIGAVASGILWLSLFRDWRKKSKPS